MTRFTEHFSLDDVPEPERAERWSELLSETRGEVTVQVPGCAPYRAALRRQWIEDLALVDCECDPCSGDRGRSRVATGSPAYLAVLVTKSGDETVAQGDVCRDLRTGDALVWDTIAPGQFAVWTRLTQRTLLIPRTALAEVSAKNWSAAGVVLDGAASATRLLTGYLDVLADSLPTLGPLAIAAARNATLELFIGALRPAVLTQFGAEGLVLRTVIETWIDRNLGLLDVTPAVIAAAHGVSVRTVHRVFTASGETVCEVVRLHRLAKAHRELSVRAEPISLIARRWGFGNSRDFIAAYQAHYGMSPSDYRASQR